MQRFRFPIAVAATSLALVALLVVAGGALVTSALASTPFGGAGLLGRSGPPWTWSGDHGAWGAGAALPPELSGLADVPAADRFAHFRGARVQLVDKDGKPFTVDVTAGTLSAASATSLTLAANDGTSRTFALDGKTAIHAGQTGQTGLAPGEHAVVLSIDNSSTASMVAAFDPAAGGAGWGPHPPFGR